MAPPMWPCHDTPDVPGSTPHNTDPYTRKTITAMTMSLSLCVNRPLTSRNASHPKTTPEAPRVIDPGGLNAQAASPEQMMEAVHVAAVMLAGITLVHSVQMQNRLEKLVL